MKKLLPLLALAFVSTGAFAQARPPADQAALRDYAKKALSRCPDAIVTLSRIDRDGPTNFVTYEVNIKSSDENCNTRKYLLHSPKTNQTVVGIVIGLPTDSRPATQRISDHTTQLLSAPINATMAPFPLPDGLRAVTLTKQTKYGPFAYHGYLDQSERFLLVGHRGNLSTEPSKTLRDAIGAANAVQRGNKNAKVEIIELSDFQCPTCARAHKAIEPIIQKNLGKVSYLRLDLPLFESHEWSVPAALGGRAIQKVAPAKYWEYVDTVFKSQELITKMKSFDQFLQNFCEDHDINWAAVRRHYTDPAERASLMAQISRAFDNNINATPTFIINGQMIGFGPDGTFVLNQIKSALGVK